MAHCDACDRVVLTYVSLDDAGAEQRLCVHCDHRLAGELHWVGAAELEQSGYQFGSPAREKACGCGGGACSARRN
jgi:hypothetical protein